MVSDSTVFQPDVLVTRRSDVGATRLEGAPLLVVEVLSPSTRLTDRGTKRLAYEAAGVPSYWLVDPHQPSLTVLHLDAVATSRRPRWSPTSPTGPRARSRPRWCRRCSSPERWGRTRPEKGAGKEAGRRGQRGATTTTDPHAGALLAPSNGAQHDNARRGPASGRTSGAQADQQLWR
ncbi:MAG: Uma2 family endonuclease [Acidimicrobiales bacterium]